MIAAEINQILSQLNASASLGEEEYRMSDQDTGKKKESVVLNKSHFPTQEKKTQTYKRQTWDTKGDFCINMCLSCKQNMCVNAYFRH